MKQANKTKKNTSNQRKSGKTQKYGGGGVTKGENNEGRRDGIGRTSGTGKFKGKGEDVGHSEEGTEWE